MLEVFTILFLTGLSCASIGTILVIKNESMIADALSHSVLLGIVLGFLISHDLNSPLLLIGAALLGLLTVFSIEFLLSSKKINHDTATGLIFPFLFSITVILISTLAKNTHLDIDMVLMGELLFAPLNRINILGVSLPAALVQSAGILCINSTFIALFYRPLQVYLLDPTQAKLAGIPIGLLKTTLVFLVSLTSVTAFSTVGSITVITFFVAPAMTGLFLANHYHQLLKLVLIITLFNCMGGYFLAIHFDLNIAGTTACFSLLTFLGLLTFKKYRFYFLKTKTR